MFMVTERVIIYFPIVWDMGGICWETDLSSSCFICLSSSLPLHWLLSTIWMQCSHVCLPWVQADLADIRRAPGQRLGWCVRNRQILRSVFNSSHLIVLHSSFVEYSTKCSRRNSKQCFIALGFPRRSSHKEVVKRKTANNFPLTRRLGRKANIHQEHAICSLPSVTVCCFNWHENVSFLKLDSGNFEMMLWKGFV